jgi:hypothetical protein
LDWRGYGTPSLRGIPLASWHGNASLSRGKLRNPHRPTISLILMISMPLNISYNQTRDSVRDLARHYLILMFNVKTAGMIIPACICNGRRGRLLFERHWRDSTKNGGAV